jgi:hypothetical protein
MKIDAKQKTKQKKSYESMCEIYSDIYAKKEK